MTRRVLLSTGALGVLALVATTAGATATPATAPQVQVHYADGSPAHLSGAVPRVQIIHTDYATWEPTLGFDRQGRAYADTAGLLVAAPVTPSKPGEVRVSPDGLAVTNVDPGTHPTSQDPYTYVDPTTGRVFLADFVGCSLLSHSDDGGMSWSTGLAGCALSDHQSIVAGPPPAGAAKPTGYPNVVYYCAITLGALSQTSFGDACQKSLDGGTTWRPTLGLVDTYDPVACANGLFVPFSGCDGVTGQVTAGPDGVLLVPRGYASQPVLNISYNEGDTWTRVQVASNGLREDWIGQPDRQTAVAVDSAGNWYYAWTARDRMPYLSFSRNKGRSWSKPLKVGKPGLHQTWHTTVDALAPGKVAVHYLATEDGARAPFPDDRSCRSDDLTQDVVLAVEAGVGQAGTPLGCSQGTAQYAKTTWNAYLTVTTDVFARRPVLVSARLNPAGDPVDLGYCDIGRCPGIGDFTDVRISPHDGTPWAVYADACTPDGKCAGTSSGALQFGRLVGIDLRSPVRSAKGPERPHARRILSSP